jgi:flavin reductase (DIM6/NTAB) family NADH-FMN oxidoreductase RutF
MGPDCFESLRRQEFRKYFQPSRVVLGVVPAGNKSGVNIITLCFSMYCSYKPPMMAVAIHNRSSTYELIQRVDEYVLAVPGISLIDQTMYCGIESMRDVDKVHHLSIELVRSVSVDVPGLARAIANIEMKKVGTVVTGDHLTVIGRVSRFGVNTKNAELPLVSIGPNAAGYTLHRRKGIHRLGTVAASA